MISGSQKWVIENITEFVQWTKTWRKVTVTNEDNKLSWVSCNRDDVHCLILGLDTFSGLWRQNGNRWLNHSDVNRFLRRPRIWLSCPVTPVGWGPQRIMDKAADLWQHDLALWLYNHNLTRTGSGGMQWKSSQRFLLLCSHCSPSRCAQRPLLSLCNFTDPES